MNSIFQTGQKLELSSEGSQLLSSLKTQKSLLTGGYGLLQELDHYRLKAQAKLNFEHYSDSEVLVLPLEGQVEFSSGSVEKKLQHPNELCVFSTGTNLAFQLKNPSAKINCQFVKLTIETITKGMNFNYRSRSDLVDGETKTLTKLAGSQKRDSCIKIEQDAFIELNELRANQRVNFSLKRSHHGVYFYLISGSCEIEKQKLSPTDALGAWNFRTLEISCQNPARLLVIEVPLA